MGRKIKEIQSFSLPDLERLPHTHVVVKTRLCVVLGLQWRLLHSLVLSLNNAWLISQLWNRVKLSTGWKLKRSTVGTCCLVQKSAYTHRLMQECNAFSDMHAACFAYLFCKFLSRVHGVLVEDRSEDSTFYCIIFCISMKRFLKMHRTNWKQS